MSVEGSYAPEKRGARVYETNTGLITVIPVDDHGMVAVSIEALEMMLTKLGYKRVE